MSVSRVENKKRVAIIQKNKCVLGRLQVVAV